MSARNMIISFIVIGLFTFAMMAFGIGIANLNDSPVSIADDPRINATFGDLDTELGEVDEDAQAQREKFEEEKPTFTIGFLLFESIIALGKTITSTIASFTNILFGFVFNTIFGGSVAAAVVMGVVLSIIILSIIFLLWRVYKAGE